MTEDYNELDFEQSQALNVEIKEDPKKFLTFLSDGLTFAIDATNVGEINTSCIIVLDINSTSIGIFVDAVSHVVDIYESNISPMPPNSSQELVKGMMSLTKEMVILFLDCELLLQ